MENQHRQITGYRELTAGEVDEMNKIKELGNQVGVLLQYMKQPGLEYDQRWVSIAQTHLQEGFMALTRSVAKPTSF